MNGIKTEDMIARMLWSTPREVTTVRGQRLLRTATPTPAFWGCWRSDQQTLRDMGIGVKTIKGDWQVNWWTEPPKQAVVTDAINREDFGTESVVTASKRDPRVNYPTLVEQPITPDAVVADQVNRVVEQSMPIQDPIVTNLKPERKWSEEQQRIGRWFETSLIDQVKYLSLVVRARAGTGKTTTIEWAISKAAVEEKILYAVFGKKNQREAMDKIHDPRVDIKTLHALGYMFILQVWTGVKPDDDVENDRILAVCQDIPDEVATQVRRMVGFAKNTCIDPTLADMVNIAEVYDVEAPGFEEPENGGWTIGKLSEVALKVMELSTKRDPQGRISFNDMVWLPVRMNWVRAWYDLVVVDECQDMNLPQLEMAKRAVKKGGRICVVGDDRQAIFGFRGAAQNGMEMMKRTLAAGELGLTTTYRCPKKVVTLAAVLVPDYKAADTAPEGTVQSIGQFALIPALVIGDVLLSRVNAPLMGIAMQLIRKGTSVRIEGRDIGKSLLVIVKKLNARTVSDFGVKLDRWLAREIKRAQDRKHAEEKCEALRDTADTLNAVSEGAASVNEIVSRINNIFQDSDKNSRPAVVLSSVHKFKGLEAERVYLLRSSFYRRPKPGQRVSAEAQQEEHNIYYVALTRAKRDLVFVEDPKGQAEKPAEKNEISKSV